MYWKTAFRMRHLSKGQGFSVIELVVIMAIIVALAVISAPVISGYSPSYNSKAAASNIVSQMQLARIHAIKNRVTTVVVFYPDSFMPADQANSFLIFEDDNRNGTIDATDNNWIHDAGENVIAQRTFMPPKVSLTAAAFTSNGSGQPTDTFCCGFDSQGVAARTGAAYVIGNVNLQNTKNQTRIISFNASGKTKVTIQ